MSLETPIFTHVKREEGEKNLHISHLHRYVSAYETNSQTVNDLINDLQTALDLASKKKEPQIVDQDGEMFFVVYPYGLISLCLRWKDYKIIPKKGGE